MENVLLSFLFWHFLSGLSLGIRPEKYVHKICTPFHEPATNIRSYHLHTFETNIFIAVAA